MTTIVRRLATLALLATPLTLQALEDVTLVRHVAPASGGFALAAPGSVVPPIVVEATSPWGLQRASGDLASDLHQVTGQTYAISSNVPNGARQVVLLGVLGQSALIDQLSRSGKLDVSAIQGKWEAYTLAVVDKPFPGVDQALVIVGSDMRGAIYGAYTLSEQIGVSPWNWWADVPVDQHRTLIWPAGQVHVDDGPTVQYRGIFLNDEAPALTGWVNEKFGGYNHEFYTKVFELMLRLRANYIWPAMWDAAFSDDDPENMRLADAYGIVMGTSHHEPMIRAHKEWRKYGKGPWDYSRNEQVLRDFWQGGLDRNKDFENIITLGMRGDGDEAMSEENNIALLERIVADQRAMIAQTYQKPLSEVPQLWALYKEVQSYYEDGMRVPDDVTLLWCDDNWGNIRRLPRPEERNRSGGAGVYYHFDYVGDPRSYKWINTTHLPRVWEQMNLAWQYDATKIWIVNVGDLKPMEVPIEYFLTLAWDPAKWSYERIPEYLERWAAREFGAEHAPAIARLVAGYTRLNSRRKPELLEPTTYSHTHYAEAERVLAEWRALAEEAKAVGQRLPEEAQDAYFQLVAYPVLACANLNEMYLQAGWNRLYAPQGRAATNDTADRVKKLFARDAELVDQYHALDGGKWNHFMAQAKMGYTIWQQPEREFMPAVSWANLPDSAEMAVAIEGSTGSWPTHDIFQGPARLPRLTNLEDTTRWIEIFNRGLQPIEYQIRASVPWVKITHGGHKADRVTLSVDWSEAPDGDSEAVITITGGAKNAITVVGGNREVKVTLPLRKYADGALGDFQGFVASNGYVSMPASSFSTSTEAKDVAWRVLKDFGNAHDGVTPFPVNAPSFAPGEGPRLDYRFYVDQAGKAKVIFSLAPTFDFQSKPGLRFAWALDDGEPQVQALGLHETDARWREAVAHNLLQISVPVGEIAAGAHTLRIWMMDPGPVLQQVQIDLGGLAPSYLGAPDSPIYPFESLFDLKARKAQSGEESR